jgi:diguanylate cyclase (GGDEF)-like protein
VTPAERRAAIEAECLDHVNRMVVRAMPFSVPAAVLLMVIVGDSVPTARRLAWIGLVALGVVIGAVTTTAYWRRRRSGRPPRAWITYCAAPVIALCWSSVVWVAFPPHSQPELRAVVLLFCLGVAGSAAVASAASKIRFYTYTGAFATPLVIVYLASVEHTTRMLGLAIPLYLLATFALHREVNSIVTSEMQLRHDVRDANERLAELALHDSMTGLYNRAAFRDQLRERLSRGHEPAALLYFDLDRFKAVNDSLGHAAGDHLIVRIAESIEPILRDGDVCARLGGDEFAILVDGVGSPDEACAVAERVRAAVARPVHIDGTRVAVGASIGVAITDGGPVDPDALLRDADDAQYHAKRAGGDSVVVFDAELADRRERQRVAESELRAALGDGRIVAWFQPQLDLESGRIVGAEALARWIHPERGIVEAGTFIGLARTCGLLDDVDLAIFRAALETRVRLRELGAPDDFRMWINIGARWMTGEHGRLTMRELLEATGCRPDELGVEITEDEVLEDIQNASELLLIARRAGMLVALDDFGTGQSSITLLRRLPIDVVKVDRSFVRDMETDPGDRTIVRAIGELAHQLDATVVAEGVERVEQLALLRAMGYDGAQGFLFSRAVPPDALCEMVPAMTEAAIVDGV